MNNQWRCRLCECTVETEGGLRRHALITHGMAYHRHGSWSYLTADERARRQEQERLHQLSGPRRRRYRQQLQQRQQQQQLSDHQQLNHFPPINSSSTSSHSSQGQSGFEIIGDEYSNLSESAPDSMPNLFESLSQLLPSWFDSAPSVQYDGETQTDPIETRNTATQSVTLERTVAVQTSTLTAAVGVQTGEMNSLFCPPPAGVSIAEIIDLTLTQPAASAGEIVFQLAAQHPILHSDRSHIYVLALTAVATVRGFAEIVIGDWSGIERSDERARGLLAALVARVGEMAERHVEQDRVDQNCDGQER
jgi:hypothetical protein